MTGEMMRPFREAPTRYWYVSDIVLRPELGGTRAIRVLLGDGLSHWIYTAAITFPFQFLALASSKEGELLLARFGFYCYQKACYAERCCAFRSRREPRRVYFFAKSARYPRRSTFDGYTITIPRIYSRQSTVLSQTRKAGRQVNPSLATGVGSFFRCGAQGATLRRCAGSQRCDQRVEAIPGRGASIWHDHPRHLLA